MTVPLYEAKSELFRTLGHPLRIRVLELLSGGPKSVRELRAQIPVNPSRLSQQLATLRHTGLVTARRKGGTVEYSLSASEIAELVWAARRALTQMALGQGELLAELQVEHAS